ncbi:EthD domain-containing protein [Hymenobacter caeli]|uniref:EthD domain-containing protein n=1 Tax=Hymenobacter caeli TaxID=2735894 RepID=A0ABX2FVK7_9BACT|nr:EthD domain-containing protein [Hymenobacter caeli]NRT20823.1 hypothetical protein [Hymenobacter caeli]
MIKQMVAVRRRPGQTHQECLDYVEHVHGDIARQGPPGVSRYVQSHVFDAAFGTKTDPAYQQNFGRDFVTELYFDSPQAMKANGESDYVKNVVRPDGRNFNDFPSVILNLLTVETELPVPSPGAGQVKVLHYLKKAEGISDDDFHARWAAAHAAVLAAEPAVAGALRRYVQSRALPLPGPATQHFGAGASLSYEGIASLWLDDEAALPHFRAYEAALMQQAGGEAPLIDFSQSFFLYTREKIIIG